MICPECEGDGATCITCDQTISNCWCDGEDFCEEICDWCDGTGEVDDED